MKPISFSIIQYRHDRAAGEALNVGIVAYDAASGSARAMFDESPNSLAELYDGFNRPSYRFAIRQFNDAIERCSNSKPDMFLGGPQAKIVSAKDVAVRIWPDQGMSLFALDPIFYEAEDLEAEVEQLFDRYVSGLRKKSEARPRRDDQKLWDDVVSRKAKFEGVAARLHKVKLGRNDVEFDLGYRSGKLYAVEPISMDYVDPFRIVERAYRLIGKAVDASDAKDEVGRIFVLLGNPRRKQIAPKIQRRVKSLLGGMVLPNEVIPEDRAESLFDSLGSVVGHSRASQSPMDLVAETVAELLASPPTGQFRQRSPKGLPARKKAK